MFDLDTSDSLPTLMALARRAAPKEALAELGRMLSGQPAYPACNGMALHASDFGTSDVAMILDLSDLGKRPTLTARMEEVGLAAFDLQLSQSDAGTPKVADVQNPAFVALRLGWLMRSLDLAFGHLEGRESFGIKLLHQPLIKAQFSEISAAVDRLMGEIQLPGAPTTTMMLSAHRDIGVLFGRAAKLMGGRGLLEGQCHGLEFLDAIFFALIRPAFDGVSDDRERG